MEVNITLGTHCCRFTEYEPAMGRVFTRRYACDTETTEIDDEHPKLIPALVVAAACDGETGVFVGRESLPAFYHAHRGVPAVYHNAAFDLKVLQAALPDADVYEAVDRGEVWDTMILKRLLSLATDGHTARGGAKLGDCARTHLGVELPKEALDEKGQSVRLGFGEYLGRPVSAIPAVALDYLAKDALATWLLFGALHAEVRQILSGAVCVWGYAGREWLADCVARFGPLTHHTQVKASVLMDALTRAGIGVDPGRSAEKARRVEALMAECKERLRRAGLLVGEPNSSKAMQGILQRFHREHPEVEMHRTRSGERWSTAEEHIIELAGEGEFFRDYLNYKAAEKLLGTYLRKMSGSRLHPKFHFLMASGRTSCGGGFNLQNLPREPGESSAAATIRGCFVPGDGRVFVDADYSQIELAVLAQALKTQFHLSPKLLELINGDQDVHRLLAATVMGKPAGEVTKSERNGVKAISFGRPGGMGATQLRRVAKNNYGILLTDKEVLGRIEAYHDLCPELDFYLQDEVDSGLAVAEYLGLTTALYSQATGRPWDDGFQNAHVPEGWLGGMLLKVLGSATPVTQRGAGRPYTQDEIAFFWDRATGLKSLLPDLAARIDARQPSPDLERAARDRFGRRRVFTLTGRLRANATFSQSRNTVFQGGAADGAVLGMWLVWRMGYKVVDFVHDQLVVELAAEERDVVLDHADQITELMVTGMGMVLPDVRVKVETVITRSLNKNDQDPRYSESPTSHTPKEKSRERQPVA